MPAEPAPTLPVGPNEDKLHANSQTFTSVRLSIIRPKSTHARGDKNAERDDVDIDLAGVSAEGLDFAKRFSIPASALITSIAECDRIRLNLPDIAFSCCLVLLRPLPPTKHRLQLPTETDAVMGGQGSGLKLFDRRVYRKVAEATELERAALRLPAVQLHQRVLDLAEEGKSWAEIRADIALVSICWRSCRCL